MDIVNLSLFISAVVVLSITPGPDLFLIVGRGISQGRAPALFTALGFFLAGFIQVPLLALGLATVVSEHPMLFDALRYFGGAYLIWRGARMLYFTGSTPLQPTRSVSSLSAIKEGFIASLVNPKSHLFLLAFLPQFVNVDAGSVASQFVLLGLVMRCVALTVEGVIAFFAGSIGQRLRRSLRLQNLLERLAGGLLVVVGARLIFMDRPD